MRTDLEKTIVDVTGDKKKVADGQSGKYNKDVFMGHCSEDGQDGYLPIVASKEVMKKVSEKIWDVKG